MSNKKQIKVAHGMQVMGMGEVKSNGDFLIIQGLANKNVIDRGNDIIEVDAWELDNFKKNPVILYNHGMDPQLGGTPIGKAIEIMPTKDGLMIKAQLSAIDDPIINRIRGLVKEKILRAFSVGFDAKEMNKDSGSGANRISKAELFEVSIVGVPMNQDSLFNITGKMMARKSIDALKKDVLNRKGAVLASAIHEKILSLQKQGKDKDKLIKDISEKSNLTTSEVLDVLAANIRTVEDNDLSAIGEVLGIDLEDLKKLAKEEEENNGTEEEENNEAEEEENNEDEEEENTKSGHLDPIDDDNSNEKQADQNIVINDTKISSANTEQENNDFGSPFLDVAKQTNVLLGVAINQLQIITTALQGISKLPEPDAEQVQDIETQATPNTQKEDDDIEDEEESNKKALQLKIDRYAKRLENVKKRVDVIFG